MKHKEVAQPGWQKLTATLLSVVALALVAGWVSRVAGNISEGRFLWRLAAFAYLAWIGSSFPRFLGAYRGRVHQGRKTTISLPFSESEFRESAVVHPSRGMSGVRGRSTLVGMALVVLSVGLALFGLTALSPRSTGTMSLSSGESSSAVVPDGVEYALATAYQFTLVSYEEASQTANFRLEDPATGDLAEFSLTPDSSVRILKQRVSLAAARYQLPIQAARLDIVGEDGESRTLQLPTGRATTVDGREWQLLGVEPGEGGSSGSLRVRVTDDSGESEFGIDVDSPQLHELESGETLRVAEVLLTPSVELRFTAKWVWWWRVNVLLLAGLGVLILVLVPHVGWRWRQQDEAWSLSLYSINLLSQAQRERYVDGLLKDLLGDEQLGELRKLQRFADRLAARGQRKQEAQC